MGPNSDLFYIFKSAEVAFGSLNYRPVHDDLFAPSPPGTKVLYIFWNIHIKMLQQNATNATCLRTAVLR